jgi:hypothetical protein
MIVQLHTAHSDLTVGQNYSVIGIESDDYRILNDVGKPYLYSAALFTLIDATESPDWVNDIGADGERYAYPPPLNEPGFFEEFFDDIPSAVVTFWQVMNQRLAQAA